MATGKFKLIDADQENFDKIMAAAGVPEEKRARSRVMQPCIEYSRDGDAYKVTFSVEGQPDRSNTFILDTELDETTPDGRKVKSVYRRDGNVITHHETQENGVEVVYVRELKGDEMHVSITCGDLKAHRIFKKL